MYSGVIDSALAPRAIVRRFGAGRSKSRMWTGESIVGQFDLS